MSDGGEGKHRAAAPIRVFLLALRWASARTVQYDDIFTGWRRKKTALLYVTEALAVGVPPGNKANAVK